MKLGLVVVVLLVVLANLVGAQQLGGIYGCLGGCYNMCILGDGVDSASKAPCYYTCTSRCFTTKGPAFDYYCRLGCSLFQCSMFIVEGGKQETCLQDCSRNLCGKRTT